MTVFVEVPNADNWLDPSDELPSELRPLLLKVGPVSVIDRP